MAKKVLAIVLAMMMLVAMFAGCQQDSAKTDDSASSSSSSSSTEKKEETKKEETKKEETKKDDAPAEDAAPEKTGPVLEEPVTVDMWIIEHSSYVYEPGLLCEQLINEYVNIFFNVTPFQTGVVDKINLGLASGELPDIYFYPGVADCTNWGMIQGALVNVLEYEDIMPNFTAWAEENAELTKYYKTADGGLYMMPQKGFGEGSNSVIWEYRKDIFDKHGIAAPTTDVELYDAAVQLKELYPDAYPICDRSWPGKINKYAHQFGGKPGQMTYDNETKQWTYGCTEPEFEEAVTFVNKLYEEKLIPENILSLDTNGWQELITTNKGFLFCDYQARIDFYNAPMRELDPTVAWSYLKPWAGGANGVHTFYANEQLILNGYACFSTSDYVEEIMKFFDWLYTDEAYIAMNWGREGESYVVNPDGSYAYTEIKQGDSGFIYQEKYSFFQRGFWTIVDPIAMTFAASDETLAAVAGVKEDSAEYVLPACPLNEERTNQYNVLNEAVNTHYTENLGKFLTGQRDMSEWSAFIDELYALGLQDMIDIYNAQQAENDVNMA